jgi:hypothetical protein
LVAENVLRIGHVFCLSAAVERKGREGRKVKTILSFAFFAVFAFDRDMFSRGGASGRFEAQLLNP